METLVILALVVVLLFFGAAIGLLILAGGPQHLVGSGLTGVVVAVAVAIAAVSWAEVELSAKTAVSATLLGVLLACVLLGETRLRRPVLMTFSKVTAQAVLTSGLTRLQQFGFVPFARLSEGCVNQGGDQCKFACVLRPI